MDISNFWYGSPPYFLEIGSGNPRLFSFLYCFSFCISFFMSNFNVFFFLLLLQTADDAFDAQLSECVDKDSISCAQIQMYRKVRSFFNSDSVDLFAGLSLVKNPSSGELRIRPLLFFFSFLFFKEVFIYL